MAKNRYDLDPLTIPASLRDTAVRKRFATGETIFCQGDRPTSMLYVLSGEIRLIRRSRRGTDIILQRTRGGFIAEASMESKAYHCDAVAAADGHLLHFPIAEFRTALDNDPAFRRAWIAQLTREIRRLRAQCERLSLNGAAERIIHYIESEGTDGAVTLTHSRKTWAAELGLTHEALYRALRRLHDDGTLTITGNRIEFTHP